MWSGDLGAWSESARVPKRRVDGQEQDSFAGTRRSSCEAAQSAGGDDGGTTKWIRVGSSD